MRLSNADQKERQTAAEFMDYAASLIETYGWRQYRMGCLEEGFCLEGGLAWAIHEARLSALSAAPVTDCLLSADAQARAKSLDLSSIIDLRCTLAQNVTEWLIAEGELRGDSFNSAAYDYSAMSWNDHPTRQASDVINALRKTALTLREQA